MQRDSFRNNKEFITAIERKLRKELKDQGGLPRNAKIHASPFTQEVLKHVLSSPYEQGEDYIITDWFLEDECTYALEHITGKPSQRAKGILLYRNIPYTVMCDYAHLKKIKPPTRIYPALDKLKRITQQHPQTLHSLAKSFQKIEENR